MSMALALQLAPVGAYCMLPGLRHWQRCSDGWRNTETGELLDSVGLAALDLESNDSGTTP